MKQKQTEPINKQEAAYLRLPLAVRYFIERYSEEVSWEGPRVVEYAAAFEKECKNNYVDRTQATFLFNMCRADFRRDHSAESEIAAQKQRFALVSAKAHKSLYSRWQITMSAEQNAQDTAIEEGYKGEEDFPRYWEIALGTIADSLCYAKDTDRKWFAKLGILA